MARLKHDLRPCKRWRDASLKTSFIAHVLVFLLVALAGSLATSSAFAKLQSVATEDAREVAGLYLYDGDRAALGPAESVPVDGNGASVFVGVARQDMALLPLGQLPPQTWIEDVSDYRPLTLSGIGGTPGSMVAERGETPQELQALVGEDGGIAPDDMAAYDAAARQAFDLWLAEQPASPYATLFPQGSQQAAGEEGPEEGLRMSPVAYYLYSPPSDEARALSTAFGFLTFLMFPLWFGACIFAAARRFYRKRLSPALATLDHAAANIAAQNLDFSVAYDRNDEMGRLARSFETMRSSLAASQKALWRTAEERKRLNAAFAHDLRTPLTVLHGKVELLEGKAPQADVRSLARQVERLERYVQAMSTVQKLEDRPVVRTTCERKALARVLGETGNALCASRGVRFALDDAGQGTVFVDGALVEEVAANLLTNAARHAQEQVTLRMETRQGDLVMAVEDDGPGFSAEALAKGCEPFFSETPSEDHFGLGLNICSVLCRRHGGSLRLENRIGEGGMKLGGCAIARFGKEDRF